MWSIIKTDEFSEWYSHLDPDAKEDIYEKALILKELGPTLGRPFVDTVNGSRHSNMKELRVQSKGRPFRIFFAFDPKRKAVFLIGDNKQGKKRFYEIMIPIADNLWDRYLEDMKSYEKKIF